MHPPNGSKYLDDLGQELLDSDIIIDGSKIKDGEWRGTIDTTRIIAHDETPQFVNYGVDGSANGLVYCGRGDACNKLIKENRECVTLQPNGKYFGQKFLFLHPHHFAISSLF